ncbi:hypothetical protein IJ425_06940 [bacterium]|nr:hypothetical protein [bacterium]
MSKASQKMQQRAELIAILNKYRDVIEIDNVQLIEDVKKISEFEDKTFVCKTILQEINNAKSAYANVCAIIILETINKEIFEKEAIECIKSEKTNDNKKFFIMSLIKQKGIDFNFKDIANYIDTAEELAHNGIVDFLENAINDPEVQIDLLDFYINIPKEEKIYFIENLIEDFEGDNLANALSILAQLNLENEELQIITDKLIDLESPYTLDGLEFILNNQKINSQTKTKIKRTIKAIKKSYPDFLNNELIKDSKIHKSYISFVDGQSNFSLILSRIKPDNTIDALLTTICTTKGVISCMGFGAISQENFNSIIKRLFCDTLPVEITPIALKSLFEHYLKKSNENEIELPYELIVWKKILNDIREINYDISEFINSKLETINLSNARVKKFVNAKILETWYYAKDQNKHVDEIIEKIEKEHLIDLDEIDKLSSKATETLLNDKNYISELQSSLLLQSYIASLAKLKITSACAYSLCFEKQHLKTLISSLIDKSIYYALNLKINETEQENLFNKAPKTSFKKEELELIMSQLEEKWS